MKIKTFLIAAGALVLSSGVASAATITNDLNLRSGPSTGYRVIDTMPAGAHVSVLGCTGSWCRVNFRGRVGYASASYLASGGYAPAPVYSGPVYYDEPYYAAPVFGFSFGFGHRGWRGGHHGGWHGGHHGGWHGGHHHH